MSAFDTPEGRELLERLGKLTTTEVAAVEARIRREVLDDLRVAVTNLPTVGVEDETTHVRRSDVHDLLNRLRGGGA